MKRKISKISIVVIIFSLIMICSPMPLQAATEGQIEESISKGLEWLVDQQNPDGSWSDSYSYFDPAITAFVLIKLQDRAYEIGKDPFQTVSTEPDYYEYHTNVIDAWDYLFNIVVPGKVPIIDPQLDGGIADTNGNGYGLTMHYYVYSTGIFLMALVASDAPDRENDGGYDYNGDTFPDTFGEIAQDVVDWLAVAQTDSGTQEGAWGYSGIGGGDNSVSGYAVLGLAAAEGFGCTVPQWVKDQLNIWINYIQHDVNGGSGYSSPDQWVNELKTGNLIFEMTFYGDDTTTVRFQNAMDYIEHHWHDLNFEPGWGYNQPPPSHYQAMYCLMKGFEYSGIDLIDLDGDNTPEHDWYQELADVLLSQQLGDGSWPNSPAFYWTDGSAGWDSGNILSTVWALLILERISPPPPIIPVYVDIKPGSWPNPINPRSKGVIPVAICGTEEFDVTTIDPVTIYLINEESMLYIVVSPLRWSYEDVATPFIDEEGGGHELTGDGIIDLVLHFDTQEVVKILCFVGATIPLSIIGNLYEEEGGIPIKGQDFVWILG